MSRRMQRGPMSVLGDDSQRISDRDAQAHNISAARAVADAVRSTLGPKGMDKMLIDDLQHVTITNDGVTILDEMDVENPTASMLIEVAEAQEDEAGDGTTTAITLTGELIMNAEELLEQDIHPAAIIRGYSMAASFVRDEIDEYATPVDADDRAVLQSVAETSLTGRGADAHRDLLSSLIVEAVTTVTATGDQFDLDRVQFETRPGQSVPASRLVTGAVLDKDPIHDDMPRRADDASILLLRESIEPEGMETGNDIQIDPSARQRFVDAEEEQIRRKVDQIVASGADVVLCQNEIGDVAQHFLAKEGIMGVRRNKKNLIEFLAEILDASIVNDLDSLDTADLGHGSVYHDSDERLLYVEGDGVPGVTLLLYGSTDHVVDEIERGMTDALHSVGQVVTDGRALPGGGATEVELARRLRQFADGVEGREQLAVDAFADALEIIPRVLAENAGLNPIDALIDLRQAHQGGNVRGGLNLSTGAVVDTFEAGVIDSASAKQQAYASAADATNLILKIDDIIAIGELSTKRPPGDAGAAGAGAFNDPPDASD